MSHKSRPPQAALPVPLAGKTALAADGKIYLVGGRTAGGYPPAGWTGAVRVYDPSTDAWTVIGSFPTSRHSPVAGIIGNTLYVAGGDDSATVPPRQLAVTESARLDGGSPSGDGTWSAAASMAGVRAAYSATLLRDGRVLALFGSDGAGWAASAEIYDPSANSWSAAGTPLPPGRTGHAAVLLADGRVLVAGGRDGGGVFLAGAQIYDPSGNSWRAAADMSRARYGHGAALLPDGRVLVAGGRNQDGDTDSSEIYDPVRDSWSAAAAMARGRSHHTTTTLADGRVLVVAGLLFDGSAPESVPLAQAEVYDPSGGGWSAAGNLAAPRSGHLATLLSDGRVLVTGGVDSSGVETGPLAPAELYDPAANSWSAAGEQAPGRLGHTATLLGNGLVLAAGGGDLNGARYSSTQLYDPATNLWRSGPDLSAPRSSHSALLLADGRVLAAGGDSGTGPLSSAELFAPSAPFWTVHSAGSPTPNPSGAPDGAAVDWSASRHGHVVAGDHLEIAGVWYAVLASDGGSWSGSAYYSATLTLCDQADKAPLSDSGGLPLYPDLSGTAGAAVSVHSLGAPAGRRPLTVLVSGSGSVSNPAQAETVGGMSSRLVAAGATFTLTATASPGSFLAAWTGCDWVAADACTVTVAGARTVTARFAKIPVQTLSLTVNGSGRVRSTPAPDIDCAGGACLASYPEGTAVQLTASPASGFDFTGWSGCDRTDWTVCTVTMSGARQVTAGFAASPPPGALREDFETGNLSRLPWKTGGDGRWSVQPYSGGVTGGYGAAGPAGMGRTGYLRFGGATDAAGTISFRYRTSVAPDVNRLRFTIDGVEQGSWSGETGWSFASFPVSGGYHVFSWEYQRDFVHDGSSDMVWIDDISFSAALDTTPLLVAAAPAGGTFGAPVTVTLSTNEAAVIHYTTNGADPTTASPTYLGPITVSGPTVLKFLAARGAKLSNLNTESYTVTGGPGGADAVWSAAASLKFSRFDQTATTLSNGKVLVTGGGLGTSSVELYDPATDSWSSVAPLATGRKRHRAALLPDGRVLVAGGIGYDTGPLPLASAELYDPATDSWSPAGAMAAGREQQTVTPLPDGRVLMAGGLGSGAALASAELYDPATNSWSTSSMAAARYGHSATPLADGRVLVAGGYDQSGAPAYLAGAELYDPAGNSWSQAGSMAGARRNHSAVLLSDGRVLVAGGYQQNGGTVWPAACALYDPAADSWSPAGALAIPREAHAAIRLLDGKVLVTGGKDSNGYDLRPAELYDPASDLWSPAGSARYSRPLPTATLLYDGKVLVLGGYGNSQGLVYADLYGPPNGSFPLSLAVNGGGSVRSVPAPDLNCSDGVCVKEYPAGATIELTASPYPDWSFSGWTGCDLAQGNVCIVAMSGAKEVAATFATASTGYTLTVTVDGGRVRSAPAPEFDCTAGVCTQTYPPGTRVYLTGTPAAGYGLLSWIGCDAVDGDVCRTTMFGARQITASSHPEELRDDFESGDLSRLPWQKGGVGEWGAQAGAGYLANGQSGGYGAGMPEGIDDGQFGWLGLDYLQPGAVIASPVTVSFRYRTSSEPGYDYLRFLVDGVEIAKWAGETPWSLASFTVSGGAHSFRWEYGKDDALSAGSDAAWIDDVWVRPDGSPPVTTASPAGGTFGAPVAVALGADEPASTYYTVNGGEPTAASPEYAGPIAISGPTVIRFFSVDAAGNRESVRTESYAFAYPLSVTVNGGGRVYSAPAADPYCGQDTCVNTYPAVTSVQLTASHDPGFGFTGWSGCDSVAGPVCTVSVAGARSVTASFAEISSYPLSVSVTGGGQVRSSLPPDIDCSGGVCTQWYDTGATLLLTATPTDGFAFGGWTGCDAAGESGCAVRMSGERTVAASFIPVPPVGPWSGRAPMPVPAARAASGVVDGKLYLIGGNDGGGVAGAAVQAYDPKTDAWQPAAPLSAALAGAAGVALHDSVYLAGGETAAGAYSGAVIRYHVPSGTSSVIGSLSTPRSRVNAALLDGKMYLVGGVGAQGVLDSIEEVDLATGISTLRAVLPQPRALAGVAAVNGRLYIFGGSNSGAASALNWEWNPANGQFTAKTPMPAAGEVKPAAEGRGTIYVVGGINEGRLTSAVRSYHPASDSWTELGALPTLRFAGAAEVIDGRLYVAGGHDGEAPALSANQALKVGEPWAVHSAGPAAAGPADPKSAVDWPAESHAPLAAGSYLEIAGVSYYVTGSAAGSWSGPDHNAAGLQQCDQQTGLPLEKDGQPLLPDLRGREGSSLELRASWTPAWRVHSSGPPFPNAWNLPAASAVDWSLAGHGALAQGNYLNIAGVYYHVLTDPQNPTATGSWSGPAFASAVLQRCDQATGAPLFGADAYPLTADTRPMAGQIMQLHHAWPQAPPDTAAPQSAAAVDCASDDEGWCTSAASVSLSASDDGSGALLTQYRIGGQGADIWTNYSGPFTISFEGTTSVFFRSRDAAGNLEQPDLGIEVKIRMPFWRGAELYGGDIAAIAFSPAYAADRTVFTGGAFPGVYRSTDGGRNWAVTGQGLDSNFVTALAASPGYAADRTLFAGTDAGLYRSTDAGSSWVKKGLPGGVAELAVSPDLPTDGIILAAGKSSGLYRSADGGESWSAVDFGGQYVTIGSLALSPDFARDRTAYAGDYSAYGVGLQRSTDGGVTWNSCGSFTPTSKAIREVAVAGDGTVFAAGFNSAGTWRSVDGCRTWMFAVQQDGPIAASPDFANDRTVVAGTYRSTDAGVGWTQTAGVAGMVSAVAVSPSFALDRTVLYGNDPLGITRSVDGGATRTSSTAGILGFNIKALVASPAFDSDRTMFAAADPGGVFRSGDGGVSWQQINAGLIETGIVSLFVSPDYATDGTVYAASTGRLYRSTDRGAGWTMLLTVSMEEIKAIAASPDFSADGVMLVMTQQWSSPKNCYLYRSTDRGATWLKGGAFNYGAATGIAFSPSNAAGPTLFLGAGTYVLHSVDGGATWIPADLGVAVNGIAVSPAFPTDRTVYAATSKGIYRSRDGGVGWAAVNVGLPSDLWGIAPVHVIRVSVDFAADRTLIVGGDKGVYRSTDAGDSWSPLSLGLAAGTRVRTLTLSPDYETDGKIFAGVYYGGIWAGAPASGKAPVASFTGTSLTGQAPLLVSLTDTSLNAPTGWSWQFGDGGRSAERNPLHTFSRPGSYAVKLSVGNTAGVDSREIWDYVTVLACHNRPVRTGAGAGALFFDSLQQAYDASAAGDTIYAQAVEIGGDLDMSRDIPVVLKGGYDCGYAANPVAATVGGALRVRAGTVKIENVAFR